ncbi:MAG TPA: alkaline phosphatase D family protein [Polyangiaceae bacterium]
MTHGVGAGDVTETRAVVWSRTDRYAAMHVLLEAGSRAVHRALWVTEAHDYAGKIVFDELEPGTTYSYRVWFSSAADESVPPAVGAMRRGTFKTPPPRGSAAATSIEFGWSGDLGGINVCRDAKESYPIFRTLTGEGLDFFIGLGDMIYGDQPCEAHGFYGNNEQIPTPVRESPTLRAYWAHWKYNREDTGLQRLFANTGYYAVWDDHEVVNDFGPHEAWHRFPPYTIGADLVPLGRRALLDYNPIYEDPKAPDRLYRSYRWGKALELVILDTRSYRDEDPVPDTPVVPKTMLGPEQRAWLERTLIGSDATFKVVVSSVTISVPSGSGGAGGRDSWASYDGPTGYEQELAGILRALRDAHVKNMVWIATDVHFATGFRYRPFPETPDFVFHEFTAGPLGAMLLPTHALDDTFHPERLFFFGPDAQPKSFDEATRYMNWGKITIDAKGTLALSIVDGLGKEAAHFDLPEKGGKPRSGAETLPGAPR